MYNALSFSVYLHFVTVRGNPRVGFDVGTGDLGKLEAGRGIWSQTLKTVGSQGDGLVPFRFLPPLQGQTLQTPGSFSSNLNNFLPLWLVFFSCL